MYEVRVEADFAAAHFLQDYHGKCERLHGHNYKVYAHARGNTLDAGGMLMDFGELKSALREVCAELDHRNLNDFDIFAQNPSAERIAAYIYSKITERIPSLAKKRGEEVSQKGKDTPYLYAVDVFETDTSRARYIAD